MNLIRDCYTSSLRVNAIRASLMSPGRRAVIASAIAFALTAIPLHAQTASDYPSRPIRLVVPVAPGFSTDAVARLVAEKLRVRLGQTVFVENKAGGAAGNVGSEFVYHSAPDGYNLLLAAPGPLAINKFLYAKLPFDPAEFVPISLVSSAVNVLVVRSESSIKTVRDVISHAKANPGAMSYSTGGAGTTQHLAIELLRSEGGGLDMLHIPYKGAAAAMQGFIQGQADITIAELGSTLPHIKSGRLRAIAVGSPSRMPVLPDVPTFSETLPGFTSTAWYGIVAPPKTPAPIAAMLSAAVVEIVKDPEVRAKLVAMNQLPIGNTSAEMTKFMKDESDRWGKVIRAAKISVE